MQKYTAAAPFSDSDSEDDIAGLRGEADSDEEVELDVGRDVEGGRFAAISTSSSSWPLENSNNEAGMFEPPLAATTSSTTTRFLGYAVGLLLAFSFVFYLAGGRDAAMPSGNPTPTGGSGSADDNSNQYGSGGSDDDGGSASTPSMSDLVVSPTTVPSEDNVVYSPTTVPSPDITTVPSPDITTVPSPDITTVPSPEQTTVPSFDATSSPSVTVAAPVKTSSPFISTSSPFSTLAPLTVDDTPVTSLADPRYGRDPVYSPGRLAYQNTITNERHVWQTVTLKEASNFSLNQRYDGFCEAEQAKTAKVYPFKYQFPKLPLDPGPKSAKLNFDPATMKRHFVQFKSALYEYRELLAPITVAIRGGFGNAGPFYNANKTASANRLGQIFAQKIARKDSMLTVGFMGSSVMSGQDNCHGLILSETFRTQMNRLIAPFQMSVDPRNMGQNGDGPDMGTQMLCAYDTLGALDLLVAWYPMIPDPGTPDAIFVTRLVFPVSSYFSGLSFCCFNILHVFVVRK